MGRGFFLHLKGFGSLKTAPHPFLCNPLHHIHFHLVIYFLFTSQTNFAEVQKRVPYVKTSLFEAGKGSWLTTLQTYCIDCKMIGKAGSENRLRIFSISSICICSICDSFHKKFRESTVSCTFSGTNAMFVDF